MNVYKKKDDDGIDDEYVEDDEDDGCILDNKRPSPTSVHRFNSSCGSGSSAPPLPPAPSVANSLGALLQNFYTSAAAAMLMTSSQQNQQPLPPHVTSGLDYSVRGQQQQQQHNMMLMGMDAARRFLLAQNPNQPNPHLASLSASFQPQLQQQQQQPGAANFALPHSPSSSSASSAGSAGCGGGLSAPLRGPMLAGGMGLDYGADEDGRCSLSPDDMCAMPTGDLPTDGTGQQRQWTFQEQFKQVIPLFIIPCTLSLVIFQFYYSYNTKSFTRYSS